MSKKQKIIILIGAILMFWSLTRQDRILVTIPDPNSIIHDRIWKINYFLIIVRSIGIAIITYALYFIASDKKNKASLQESKFDISSEINEGGIKNRFCGKCGKQVPKGDAFCGSCGNKITDW